MSDLKLDFLLSAVVSGEVVTEWVKQEIERQTGRSVKKITPKIVQSSGYRDDYTATVFAGYDVEFLQTKTLPKV